MKKKKEDKTFKTIDELVNLLKRRNVIIEDDQCVGLYLLGHSYYAVVNGYKEPFLDQEKTKELGDDFYKDGTRFLFFSLMYSMDSMLRDYTRSYLLQAEEIMKNATIYAFCYYHREEEEYLDPASYCSKGEYYQKRKYTSNLIKLLNTLQRNRDNSQRKEYIDHYLKEHGYVPLWVLENALTFGNMSAFFDLQTTKVQNAACRNVEKISQLEPYSLGIKEMRTAYRVLSSFRNICSHEERLYCARVGRNRYSFGDMFKLLEKIISETDMNDFARTILMATYPLRAQPDIKCMVFEAMDIDEAMVKERAKRSALPGIFDDVAEQS